MTVVRALAVMADAHRLSGRPGRLQITVSNPMAYRALWDAIESEIGCRSGELSRHKMFDGVLIVEEDQIWA
jgi:hypothetical protein